MSGYFTQGVPKNRPGMYVNFDSSASSNVAKADKGTVIIPIVSDFGTKASIVEITSDNINQTQSLIGYSITDNSETVILVREALKRASSVKLYPLNDGVKATTTVGELTATAPKAGAYGNQIKLVITEKVSNKFEIIIYYGTTLVERISDIDSIEALISYDSKYLVFSGTGNLTATAGTNLAGGENGESQTKDFTDFLDALENLNYDSVAIPMDIEEDVKVSLVSKAKYLKETLGHTGQIVVHDFEADYEGIINVVNGVVLSDGTVIDSKLATSYVAALCASCNYNKSNTYEPYDGAVSVKGILSNEEAEVAIDKGKFFFSLSTSGVPVVEYDINSLVNLNGKIKNYRKNRFIRTLDALFRAFEEAFPPNRYNNIPEDWDKMDSVGFSILKEFEDNNGISDVDYENDFAVDRNSSIGDSTFINVAIKTVDSSEKIYITIKTA